MQFFLYHFVWEGQSASLAWSYAFDLGLSNFLILHKPRSALLCYVEPRGLTVHWYTLHVHCTLPHPRGL